MEELKAVDIARVKEEVGVKEQEARAKQSTSWFGNEPIPESIGEKLFAAEHHISVVRFILVLFNSFVYLFLMGKAETLPWLAYTIIGIANAYGLLIVVYKPYARFPIIQSSYFTTITDGALITLWIIATGYFSSPFFLIWYVSIIAVAMRYSVKETFFSGLVYMALYMLILALDDQSNIIGWDAVSRLGYIPICALLGIYFSREISDQLNDKLTTQKAEAELKVIKDELEERVKRRTIELEEKNNDITASISYAQKIQNAILPSINTIKKSFDDASVLYLPKDIISGDFYWYHHNTKENACYVAAVDCTGHGVPGALMSMMGADFLNQHIIEGDSKQPKDILAHIDESVINALKQRDASNMINDGMEMALCKFTCHGNRKTLSFAGANRPVYIVRNGEILCFEGSRQAIGGHSNNHQKEFTQQEIPVETGDAVYLFTDGIIDQFGGPNSKKFMKKRFKEALLEVSEMTMDSQRDGLHRRLVKWQGYNKQIDDILVISLRI